MKISIKNKVNVQDSILLYDYDFKFIDKYYQDNFIDKNLIVWFYEYECTINGYIDAYELSFLLCF